MAFLCLLSKSSSIKKLSSALVGIRQNSLVLLNLKNCAGDFAPLALAELGQLLDNFGFVHKVKLTSRWQLTEKVLYLIV